MSTSCHPPEPCVVAIIKGGLGNQLFAYAGARAFALRTGRRLFIDDDSGFQLDGYGRRFRLDQFPIVATPAPGALKLGNPKALRHRWTRGIDRFRSANQRRYFAERKGILATDLLEFQSRSSVVYLNGYWQDPACFEDCAPEIRTELEPPLFQDSDDQALEKELASSDSIFVHVRRVRYSPLLDESYYETAIQRALEAIPSASFEFFGDDLAWARDHLNLRGLPVRYHEGSSMDELRDFRLMAACRHAIVANSSFSWWAAWLRDSAEKHVWTPSNPGWPVQASDSWHPVPNQLVTG